MQRHFAAERPHAVHQTLEARTSANVCTSKPVVADPDVQPVGICHNPHIHHGGTGMFGGVSQCLGHRVVRGELDLLGQPAFDCDLEYDRERRSAGQRLECRTLSAVGQYLRMDAAGDLEQILQHAGQSVRNAVQPLN